MTSRPQPCTAMVLLACLCAIASAFSAHDGLALDASLVGESGVAGSVDRRITTTRNGLASQLSVCGIGLKSYPFAFKEGPLGLAAYDRKSELLMSPMEKKQLTPVVQLQEPDEDTKAYETLAEAIVGKLVSDAALPDTPVAHHVGVVVHPEDEKRRLTQLLQFPNSEFMLSDVLNVGNPKKSLNGKPLNSNKNILKWEDFVSKASFIALPREQKKNKYTGKRIDSRVQYLDAFLRQKNSYRDASIIMARMLDAALVIVQQLLLGAAHYEELGASHGSIQPHNIVVKFPSGTVEIKNTRSAKLGYANYFLGQPLTMSVPVLPYSFKSFQPQCSNWRTAAFGMTEGQALEEARRSGKATIRDLLMDTMDELPFEDNDYISPLRHLMIHSKHVISHLEGLLGQEASEQWKADARQAPAGVAGRNLPRGIPTNQDLYSIGLILVELLVGSSLPFADLETAACDNPKQVVNMALGEEFAENDCHGAGNGYPQGGIAWGRSASYFALSKWLGGDGLHLKEPPVNEALEKSSQQLRDKLRRRTYAWLYNLARYSPVAMRAAGEGRRKTISGSLPPPDLSAGLMHVRGGKRRRRANKEASKKLPSDALQPLQGTIGGDVIKLPPDRQHQHQQQQEHLQPLQGTIGGDVIKLPPGQEQHHQQQQQHRFLRSAAGESSNSSLEQAFDGLTDVSNVPISPFQVVYTKDEISIFPDSPIGFLFDAPPRIDGKVDVAVATTFTIGGGNAIDLTFFPYKGELSDAFPRYGFLNTNLPTLAGKTRFDVTEADLEKSAEKSPQALAVDFKAKKGSAGIVDLVRGLLALQLPKQLSARKALDLIDVTRVHLYEEMKVASEPLDILKGHLNCVKAGRAIVSALRAEPDPAKVDRDALLSGLLKKLNLTPESDMGRYVNRLLGTILASEHRISGLPMAPLFKKDSGITSASFESTLRQRWCKYEPAAGGSTSAGDALGLPPGNDFYKGSMDLPTITEEYTGEDEAASTPNAITPPFVSQSKKLKINIDIPRAIKRRLSVDEASSDSKSLVPLRQLQPGQLVPLVESLSLKTSQSALAEMNAGTLHRKPNIDRHDAGSYLVSVLAQKGPVSGGFLGLGSNNFDFQPRRIDVFLDKDSGDRTKVRPSIRWLDVNPSQRALAGLLDPNLPSTQTLDGYKYANEKSRKSLYLDPRLPKPLTCAELEQYKRDSPALRLPSLRDQCGAGPRSRGVCICVLLSKSKDAYTPDDVLRVLFKDEQEAALFQRAVEAVVASAFKSQNVRRLPGLPISQP